MIFVRHLLLPILLFTVVTVSAQEIAQTETGKRVRLNPDGTWIALDADSTSGFNPKAAKFFVGKVTKPTQLKGMAEISSFGSDGSFRDEKDQYYSFYVKCEGFPSGNQVVAHIRRDTPEGERLFEALSDGKKHKVVLEMRFRTRAEQKPHLVRIYEQDPPLDMLYDSNYVLITKVVAIDTWKADE